MKKIILFILILFFGFMFQTIIDYRKENKVMNVSSKSEKVFDVMYCETLQRNGLDCTQAWK